MSVAQCDDAGIPAEVQPVRDPHAIPEDSNPMDQSRDARSRSQHLREDPHFIAEFLGNDSSKAGAILRRYDKLAIYRLLLLSRELRTMEKKHEACMDDGRDLEEPESEDYGDRVGTTIKEYCMRLFNIQFSVKGR